MGKHYNGGIKIATGFKLEDPQPIVDYMVVDAISDLTAIPNQFEGMTTYVIEDQNIWVKSNPNWKIASPEPEIPTLQTVTDEGNTTTNDININGASMSITGNLIVKEEGEFFNPGNVSNVSRLIHTNDGGILMVGNFTTFNGEPVGRIVKLDSLGNIDNTFNSGTGFDAAPVTIVEVSDGYIIAGYGYNGGYTPFTEYNGTTGMNGICKLNLDGTIDNTFELGSGTEGNFGYYKASDIRIDSNENIYIMGSMVSYNGNVIVNANDPMGNYSTRDKIIRLLPDGSFDNTFESNIIQTDNSCYGFCISDDVIYANVYRTVYSFNINGTPNASFLGYPNDLYDYSYTSMSAGEDGKFYYGNSDINGKSIIDRLLPDGTLDMRIEMNVYGNVYYWGPIIELDGFIYIQSVGAGGDVPYVFKYNLDGTPDSGFTSAYRGSYPYVYAMSVKDKIVLFQSNISKILAMNLDGSANEGSELTFIGNVAKYKSPKSTVNDLVDYELVTKNTLPGLKDVLDKNPVATDKFIRLIPNDLGSPSSVSEMVFLSSNSYTIDPGTNGAGSAAFHIFRNDTTGPETNERYFGLDSLGLIFTNRFDNTTRSNLLVRDSYVNDGNVGYRTVYFPPKNGTLATTDDATLQGVLNNGYQAYANTSNSFISYDLEGRQLQSQIMNVASTLSTHIIQSENSVIIDSNENISGTDIYSKISVASDKILIENQGVTYSTVFRIDGAVANSVIALPSPTTLGNYHLPLKVNGLLANNNGILNLGLQNILQISSTASITDDIDIDTTQGIYLKANGCTFSMDAFGPRIESDSNITFTSQNTQFGGPVNMNNIGIGGLTGSISYNIGIVPTNARYSIRRDNIINNTSSSVDRYLSSQSGQEVVTINSVTASTTGNVVLYAGGTSSFTGDDVTTTMTIAHGLGQTPSTVSVSNWDNNAAQQYNSKFDATNINIEFLGSVPTGGQIIALNWVAFK